MFSKKINVRYSEMDYKLALKPSALLNYFQDIASENAEKLGFGYSYIIEKNLAWFLLKYHIEFSDYPVGEYELTVNTEPRGYQKLFAFRDFELCNKEKTFARAISSWALVDIENGKLSPIKEALSNNPQMPIFEKRDSDLSFTKIQTPQNISIEKTFEIRYDDIDVNQHANNCNYIIWALEPLSLDFKSNHHLKTVDIVYKKEIKYGNNILSQIEIVDETHTNHLLKNVETGEDLCVLNIEWD